MSVCRHCGCEVAFRWIDGRIVPLGCGCEEIGGHYRNRDERTRWTYCPVCGSGVYFIDYNGGCVWVDELGALWPKHGCFAGPGKSAPTALMVGGQKVDEVAKIVSDRLISDLGQRFVRISCPDRLLELYVVSQFWPSARPPGGWRLNRVEIQDPRTGDGRGEGFRLLDGKSQSVRAVPTEPPELGWSTADLPRASVRDSGCRKWKMKRE